ncbi:MAG: hypothetical protein DCF30_15320 [Hyphomicrobiales bacterium]|nr:MAG: hypothetical protein DCF30_15320 [Hyphomicrobiales bacterium]
MLSFEVDDAAAAMALCSRAKIFRSSTSLGSPESLIEHRRSTEGGTSDCPPGPVRLSVGLEHRDDLQADLRQMLCAHG